MVVLLVDDALRQVVAVSVSGCLLSVSHEVGLAVGEVSGDGAARSTVAVSTTSVGFGLIGELLRWC